MSIQEIVKHYPQVKGIHPVCLKTPEMDSEQFEQLKHSIEFEGLIDPISLDQDGLLVDGKCRLRACYETGTEPRFEIRYAAYYQEEHAHSKNILRRHLTKQELQEIRHKADKIMAELVRQS